MDGHVYAYNVPKSSEQQAYTQARIAQLTAQRREQRRSWDLPNEQQAAATRSCSYSSAASAGKARDSGIASPPPPIRHQRHASGDDSSSSSMMEATRANAATATPSQHSDAHHQALLNNPFELRHGRRYLRDVPYPLPCDLAEMQRQNLRTLLACRIFGKPYCSPNLDHAVPRRVLELGCGSGYWSAMAHDHFCALGHADVSFTGVDVAPLAADLRRQGVDWRFVQHDVQRLPWPFEDGEFDVVMVRDLSLVMPMSANSAKHLDESIRVLRDGGTLEIWDSDLIVRALLPHSLAARASAPFQPTQEQEIAERTATFPMAAGAPFAPAQNRYLLQANAWISEALDRRRFSPVPCARIAQLLLQEPDLGSIGVRRVAIPLGGELPWERDAADHPARGNSHVSGVDSPMSVGRARTAAHISASTASSPEEEKDKHDLQTQDGEADEEQLPPMLTPDQLALRQTALITVLQMIESFEPLLKEVSGKNTEEWSTWWASMMAELTDPSKANLSGECLELGVWWASKLLKEG